MTHTTKYFAECSSGAVVELSRVQWADVRDFEKHIGRPRFAEEKLVREGRLFGFGTCADCARIHPLGRRIHYSKSPSGHLCNAKCLCAVGPDCECSCGGKNHGAGFILSGSLFGEDAAA